MQPVSKLRRSDFLPVGEEKEGEQLERGCSSFLWQAPYAYYGHGMFGENGNDSSSKEYDTDEDMAKIGSGMFNEDASSDEDGDHVLNPAHARIAADFADVDFS